jgi:deoxyadenosine/deoxycytidine kinase
MSFLAARFQQLKDELGNQDLFKSFTISDYFIIKSLIFARKTLAEDEYSLYTRFFNIILTQLPKPELMVYLHVETPRLQANIKTRGRSYEQNIKDEYLNKISDGYFDYIRQNQNIPILVIDTNNIDFVHNPGDYQKLIKIIDNEYEAGIHRIIP